MNHTTLIFDPRVSTVIEQVTVCSKSGEELREGLTNRGVEHFQVQWLDFGPLLLPVEDDAEFVFDAFQELEAFTKGELPLHHAFLGDGGLEMTGLLDGPNTVKIHCKYCPHLRAAFKEEIELRVSLAAYVSAWTSLASSLETLDVKNPPSL